MKLNNAIQLHAEDNVVVALNSFEINDEVYIKDIGLNLKVVNKIPYGHKICVNNINAGDKILKYGECMGIATQDINLGQHVHVHNVRGLNESERLVSVNDFSLKG